MSNYPNQTTTLPPSFHQSQPQLQPYHRQPSGAPARDPETHLSLQRGGTARVSQPSFRPPVRPAARAPVSSNSRMSL
ncbi:uncharacterized protein K452DRAFT_286049 [Aplosporella prunicola CBS 121167]|uniref:Uncharacterized protein n=1 Tax=Aplosporella prunicola CBS 121167 TaxID=1176127 RepID=A0A6A6BIU3_9PEZI|nr:uncharacterized protein K452DRAFT_286049 [Aplosporella prunicola CBS 121167]KAF2143225.1 hypothetical protein K452DRAFT_286049 [Aplosporella prunicola CBS 121167]